MGVGQERFARALTEYGEESRLDELCVHRPLGIAFAIPSGWVLSSERAVEQVKAGQILDMSAEVAWRVIAETDLPFATISRDGISADSDSFTPGASFFASPAPETPTDVDRLDRLAENDLDQIRAILRDFRDVAPAKRLVVSDCPAMLQTAAFLFEHVRLTPVPVRMQTLVVDASDRVFTIRMYDATDKCPADQFDYGPMISSLLIR